MPRRKENVDPTANDQLDEAAMIKAKQFAQAASLYLKGNTQAAIGVELGVTQQRVSVILRQVHELWKAAAVRDLEAHKADELARIANLESTYWEAWERSKKDLSKRRQHLDVTKREPTQIIIDTEESAGDPRYLDGVQWCIEQRCKLLGLHAPAKVAGMVGVMDMGKIGSAPSYLTPEASKLADNLLALVAGEG